MTGQSRGSSSGVTLEVLRRKRLLDQGLSPTAHRCPECNSRPGARCYYEDGKKMQFGFHDARWALV